MRVWDLESVHSEQPVRQVETPPEIARSRDLVGVYVIDPTTAISVTADPEWLQLWDLSEGRCLQSVAGNSAAGKQLRERIRGRVGSTDLSFCARPRSEWGSAIRGATARRDGPSPGVALVRERQREDGAVDSDGTSAFYPLPCRHKYYYPVVLTTTRKTRYFRVS